MSVNRRIITDLISNNADIILINNQGEDFARIGYSILLVGYIILITFYYILKPLLI